jgi:hypothetical protein
MIRTLVEHRRKTDVRLVSNPAGDKLQIFADMAGSALVKG